VNRNLKLKIRNFRSGITLVEIVVVIAIMAIFFVIVISDFPKIMRQFALSRATYKLAQDLRRTEDMGFSGVSILDSAGTTVGAYGYGIFLDYSLLKTQYIIYADVNNDQTYSPKPSENNCVVGGNNYNCCEQSTVHTADCAIEVVDLTKESSSLSIDSITNLTSNSTSINFLPPNPNVKILNISGTNKEIEITLKNTDDAKRKVLVNTSGLISITQ